MLSFDKVNVADTGWPVKTQDAAASQYQRHCKFGESLRIRGGYVHEQDEEKIFFSFSHAIVPYARSQCLRRQQGKCGWR
ncbi:hypothetical protein D3C81_1249390 [compost metagenome]